MTSSITMQWDKARFETATMFGVALTLVTLGGSGCGSNLPASAAGGAATSAGGGALGSGGASVAGRAGEEGGFPAFVPTAGPGCGLASAAFCDSFDAPSANRGRAGELSIGKWSGGRMAPQLPTRGGGPYIGIGKGTLPSCRAGLPAQVFPDQDTLVCDPNGTIDSNHLLVVAAAQNYGQNSYRIRQPFDFARRTGKIVLDAEAFLIHPLLGWISVAVTEDPMAVPNFAVLLNDEGGILPRRGLSLVFANNCAGLGSSPSFAVRMLNVFEEYKGTAMMPDSPVCVSAGEGKLNHIEIDVSKTKVTVSATPASADGKTFPPLELLYSADVNLPFSRGYVSVSVHNHATKKYSEDPGFGAQHPYDAWVARFDNVAFDGPVVSSFREYEVLDSLSMSGAEMSIGYLAADVADGPSDTLVLKNVDLAGATSARLTLSSWYLADPKDKLPEYVLKYRFNGGAWRDRRFSAGEIANFNSGTNQGAITQMMDVELTDLVSGENTLEFVTENVPQNYPPAVANIDLVLTTE